MLVSNILRFALIMAIQILLLNNVILHSGVSLMGYNLFVPYFYILFLLMLPVSLNKTFTLIICFITGLVMDLFCNTHGLHASACLVIGFTRPYIVHLFFNSTDKGYPKALPTLKKLGIKNFVIYSMAITLIFNFYYNLVDIWSIHHILLMLLKTIFGTIVSVLLFILSQALFITNNTNRR